MRPFSPKERSLDAVGEVVTHVYSDDEIRHYFDLGREYLCLSEDQVDDAQRELRNGGDGFIKALLISLCPRLEDLKFVKQKIPNESQDVPEKVTDESRWWRELPHVAPTMHSTAWLKRAAFNIVDEGAENKQDQISWPPGFAAICDVAVGICPDGYDSFIFDDETADVISYEVLCCLFSLPNVDSIYFGEIFAGDVEIGYDLGNWDYGDEHWRLPYGTSSVRHLCLHRILALHRDFGEAMVHAPRQLQSASFLAGAANSCEDTDSLIMQLCEIHNGSLESLMLYGDGLRGYRCIMYLPTEVKLPNSLRQATVNASDIMLDFSNDAETNYDTVRSLVRGFKTQLPKTLEVLNLVGCAPDMDCVPRNTLDCLDACFELVIDSRVLPNLKTIYLEDVEKRTIRKTGKPSGEFYFTKAVGAGRRAGIDIHAIANRDAPKHGINLPRGLDKYDLKTGPFRGARPTDGSLSLNVARGVWEETRCDYCGKCEDCLELYTNDVWKIVGAGNNS